MPRGLDNWLRRRFLRSRRRAALAGGATGQWLSEVFYEPRSKGLLAPKQGNLAYRLYLPAGVTETERLPLLVMLHGCNQTAVEFAEGTRMNVEAEERYCAVLYPEQSRRANSLRCWNWFEPESLSGQGEAALIMHTVLHVIEGYPIDAARVYMVGLSAGGAMAAILCATYGHLFAACAIHSGVIPYVATTSLQAMQVMQHGASAPLEQIILKMASQRGPGSRLVPTLIIHGTDDQRVDPINAQQMLEQTRLLAAYVQPSGDAPTLRDEQWIEGEGRRYRQLDLVLGSKVLLRSILIDGLGHAWSGGDPRHNFFDATGPDASRLILEFLLPRRLPRALKTRAELAPITA